MLAIDDPIKVHCCLCGWELDLNKTDWCTNCDTSIFDDKINNELGKLIIKNISNTDGLNIVGVSITEWLVDEDKYNFLAYAEGHKWIYTLGRMANPDGKYELTLHASLNTNLIKTLGVNEIKIKRLFYKSIKGLVDDHLDNVTQSLK